MKTFSIQGNMIGRDDKNGPQGSGISDDVSFPVTKTDIHAVAFMTNMSLDQPSIGLSPTLKVSGVTGVRRLTPVECERLQGFPDGYTDIKPNGKPTPDGPRYKALGNSMAVNCMEWIGTRIQMVEDITKDHDDPL